MPLPPPLLRIGRAQMVLPLVCACGSGCGGGKYSYAPFAATAHQALETALSARKNGQPTDAIKDGPAPIQVMDSD